MTRDRIQTENRLIDAIHELLTNEGFEQIKINRVAQQAKVNKILIYRYFGGLDGLVQAYFSKYKPVITVPPINVDRLRGVPLDEFFKICQEYVIDEFRLLRTNPQAQRFLKNDLLAYQPGVTNPYAEAKESTMQAMIDELSALIQTDFGRSFSAIIISGMTLLTFMAQDGRRAFGIDLQTDEGWAEIEGAIGRIYEALAVLNKARIGDTIQPTNSSDAQEEPA